MKKKRRESSECLRESREKIIRHKAMIFTATEIDQVLHQGKRKFVSLQRPTVFLFSVDSDFLRKKLFVAEKN